MDAKPFADGLHTTVTIRLSYADRLRVLFGARLVLKVHVRTENVVGATETSSEVIVGTPRAQPGYADATTQSPAPAPGAGEQEDGK